MRSTGALVSYYRLVFPRLKPSTQAMRRNILNRFRAKHGNKPVAQLERRHIDRHDRRDGKDAARSKQSAQGAAACAGARRRHQFDRANPALKVQKFKTEGDGIHTWSESEIIQFSLAICSAAGTPRADVDAYTGQRRSDVVRMG